MEGQIKSSIGVLWLLATEIDRLTQGTRKNLSKEYRVTHRIMRKDEEVGLRKGQERRQSERMQGAESNGPPVPPFTGMNYAIHFQSHITQLRFLF